MIPYHEHEHILANQTNRAFYFGALPGVLLGLAIGASSALFIFQTETNKIITEARKVTAEYRQLTEKLKEQKCQNNQVTQ